MAHLCDSLSWKEQRTSRDSNGISELPLRLWKPRFPSLVVFTIGENDDFRKKAKFPYLIQLFYKVKSAVFWVVQISRYYPWRTAQWSREETSGGVRDSEDVRDRDPRLEGDRDKLSAERRALVIIGITLNQHLDPPHTLHQEN